MPMNKSEAIQSAVRVNQDMVEHQNELDNRTETVAKLNSMIQQLESWRDEIVDSMELTDADDVLK